MDGSGTVYELVAIDKAGREVHRLAVQTLPLRPDEVLVVRPPAGQYLHEEEIQRMTRQLEAILPGQRVLVLGGSVELLRLAPAARRPAPPVEVVATPGTGPAEPTPLDGMVGSVPRPRQ